MRNEHCYCYLRYTQFSPVSEVVPDWSADDLLSILANRVFVVPLPNITGRISEPGSHYSSLQVIAEQTSTSISRTLTEYPISNNGSLYLLEEIPLPTNISNVTIGEENSGERRRRDVVEQLPPGWYNFYIGFLPATELHPVYLHVVPGGEGIQGNVNVTTDILIIMSNRNLLSFNYFQLI